MKSIIDEKKEEKRELNPVFWLSMGAAALVIAGIIMFLMVQSTSTPKLTTLEGALREGAEFEQLKSKLVIEPDLDRATESPTALGTIQMNVPGIIRNFTGKTIVGLEVVGEVIDLEGKMVREQNIIAVPNRQKVLENNKTMPINVIIEGFKEDEVRANIRWRLAAIKVQ